MCVNDIGIVNEFVPSHLLIFCLNLSFSLYFFMAIISVSPLASAGRAGHELKEYHTARQEPPKAPGSGSEESEASSEVPCLAGPPTWRAVSEAMRPHSPREMGWDAPRPAATCCSPRADGAEHFRFS